MYPLKLVIINSPVFVSKLYWADAVGSRFNPVESYKVYEVKLQYVGSFWIKDKDWAVKTENDIVKEFKF